MKKRTFLLYGSIIGLLASIMVLIFAILRLSSADYLFFYKEYLIFLYIMLFISIANIVLLSIGLFSSIKLNIYKKLYAFIIIGFIFCVLSFFLMLSLVILSRGIGSLFVVTLIALLAFAGAAGLYSMDLGIKKPTDEDINNKSLKF